MKLARDMLMFVGAVAGVCFGFALADAWAYWIEDMKDRARRLDDGRWNKGELE